MILQERIKELEEENEELKRINKQLNETCDDFDREHTRIYLEWQKLDKALDKACLILSNNVELKNKKGEVLIPRKRYWKQYLLDEIRKEFIYFQAKKKSENDNENT